MVGEQRRFGDVEVEVVPRSGGGAVQVQFPVDPTLVPEQFHAAIEDSIKTKVSSIGDWGDPLIDAVVRVTGGSTHPVDGHESAFSQAASRAIEDACDKAGLQSLEPVMTVVIEVPEELFGTISTDLSGRRAEIIDRSDPVRGALKITAAVPLAEMFGYANDIRSRTQGRASFTMEPRAYALVPEGKRPKLF
jgi:elongation factor G